MENLIYILFNPIRFIFKIDKFNYQNNFFKISFDKLSLLPPGKYFHPNGSSYYYNYSTYVLGFLPNFFAID